MKRVAAPKAPGLAPTWVPYPGFTVLFDAPDSAFQFDGDVERLVFDGSIPFFEQVRVGFWGLDPNAMFSEHGLCALPPESYHVTAYDVAKVADLPLFPELQEALDFLPRCEAFQTEFLSLARESDLVRNRWDLSFGYGNLCVWGGVMVLLLSPLDDDAYGQFYAARTQLSRTHTAKLGIGAGEMYLPHLSLGYFSKDPTVSSDQISEWDNILRSAVGDVALSFDRASLYGFTDMASFFKCSAVG